MLIKEMLKAAARPAILLGFAGISVTCLTHAAFAEFPDYRSSLLSTSLCTFSAQLQSSVSARKQYLVDLANATGGAVSDGGAVDDMYGNTREASLQTDNEGVNMWGFSTRSPVAPRVDTFSFACVGCHDGATALAVQLDLRNDPYRSTSKHMLNASDHPIGMDYAKYVGRQYKPISGAGNMVFIDGRVGCLTCHNPLNPEKGHLVMSDRGSALCLTCHNK